MALENNKCEKYGLHHFDANPCYLCANDLFASSSIRKHELNLGKVLDRMFRRETQSNKDSTSK